MDNLPGVILMLAANPSDRVQLDLEREYEHLDDRLRGRGHEKLRYRPKARATQLAALLQDHRDVRLVHYSGHGSPAGQLEFEDASGRASPTDPDALAAVFAELGRDLSCVFINACHSQRQAELIGQHVAWVVGMADAVSDAAAIEFSGIFYVELANGSPVDAAFRTALASLRLSSPAQAQVPRLYHRGELVRSSESPGGEGVDLESELDELDSEIRRRTLAGEATDELSTRVLELRRLQRSGPALAPGQLLAGRYELGEIAGKGGFATVWKAYDRERKGLVAVKVLHGQHAHDRSRRERFEAGTRRMDALNHPGIVKVIERPRDTPQGHYFYVLPWYPGGDLRRARADGSLDRDAALRALAPVLEGLAYAHQKGVIHRDLKPSNILLDEQGHGSLSDFDLAQAQNSTLGTRTGAMGTFTYAAPEQLKDASRVDAKTDLYAAGMTVLFALTGQDPPALVARTEPEILESLPCGEGLRAVLRRAVAYATEERTATCIELAAALRLELAGGTEADERCVSPIETGGIGGPVGVTPTHAAAPAQIERASRPWFWAVVAVAVVVVLGLVAWSNTQAGTLGPMVDEGSKAAASVLEELASKAPENPEEQPVESAQPENPPWPFESGTDDYGPWASFRVGDATQRMRWVEAGTFTMGSPEDEEGRFEDEGPQHRVELTRGFWVAETECTQALWEAVMGTNHSGFKGPSLPVENVSWDEVQTFLEKLNEAVPGLDAQLPTEAQWEYAARAGDPHSRHGPLDEVAWYAENSGGETHSVATKRANAWGLHDVLGNVSEWTSDASSSYIDEPVMDPLTSSGQYRVSRGGSWNGTARGVRAACRLWLEPGRRDSDLGFRLVRGQPAERSE